MGKLQYPTWESEYLRVILEVNARRLPDRIAAAHQAINQRLMQLTQGLDGDSERQAIRNAPSALGAVQAIYNAVPTTVIL